MVRAFWQLYPSGLAPVVLALTMTLPAMAQSPTTAPATRPSTAPQDVGIPTTMPSAQTIEKQLMDQLEPSPVVQPTQGRRDELANDPPMMGTVGIDPRVLGVAPGQEPPKLRREGEFIISRRGRMIQSPNGHHILFVFEADSDTAPEPPMILSACQMLQNMENIVRERGDKVVFILSGQILVYRGVNHLLPTMMRLAIDHGNLNK